MENKELRNLGLLFGAVAGGLTVAYFFTLYFSGLMLFDDAYKLDFWVTVPMVVMAVVYVRKVQNELRMWQGLLIGFYIVIACSTISALFYYIFVGFIDTDFMQLSWEHRLGLIKSSLDGATSQKAIARFTEVYDITKEISKTSGAYDVAIDKIIWHYFVGLLITFFTSLILRK